MTIAVTLRSTSATAQAQEGPGAVLAQIDPQRYAQGIRIGLTDATLMLQRYIQADKLSGQVLNNQTGTLRRSINQKVEDGDNGPTGYVGSFAGYLTPGPHPQEAAGYAKINEYGLTVEVPEHDRQATMVFGRKLRFPITEHVRAYSAHYPQRSFLRSSLTERRPAITKLINAGIKEAMTS